MLTDSSDKGIRISLPKFGFGCAFSYREQIVFRRKDNELLSARRNTICSRVDGYSVRMGS